MRPWLSIPFLPTARLAEVARAAEASGVTGLALSDHLCVPPTIDSDYPYAADGRAELPLDSEFPDPLVLAAALGVATTRLRLMTSVLVAPVRPPLLLAKEVATAAALTGGRVDLGVGVGWMKEEFDAIGVPFAERGSRLDETLGILRRLWTGELVSHEGRHFQFEALAMNPVPPVPVCILVGGHSEPALRRAARFGDGWVGSNPSVEELKLIVSRLHEVLRSADRTDEFEIRTGFRGRLTPERLRTLRHLGVTDLLLSPWQIEPSASMHDLVVGELIEGLPRVVEAVIST
jgi:probable F420-dependent oxidoreductase